MVRILYTFILIFAFAFSSQSQSTFNSSNLPIVIIDTNGEQIQDEPKIEADMKIIFDKTKDNHQLSDTIYDYNGKIGIEFRGSSSQQFPKKPYGFKTRDEAGENISVSLLGMPKEDTWTFNATFNDKTLMRDGLTYILAGRIMDYAPRVSYTELFLNNEYDGVYLLIEKITRNKNRVNVSKMSKSDNDGDDVTGGYIIKIDKETGSNSGEGWYSQYESIAGWPQRTFFQYEYPKVKNITTEQKAYIKNYIDEVENTIHSENYDDPVNGYRKYIDTKSLIDFIIINELSKNPDAYRLSTFLHKDRDSQGGKLKFGPVWDFNLGWGNVNYCTNGEPEGLVISEFNEVCYNDYWVVHFWWEKFLNDESFYTELKQRWSHLRENQFTEENIINTVDSLAQLVSEAQVRNFDKWPILGEYIWPNYYVGQTYEDEVAFLKNWIHDRLNFLDQEWLIDISDVENVYPSNVGKIYPNPAFHTVTIHSDYPFADLISIEIVDAVGNNYPYYTASKSEYQHSLDVSGLPAGTYFIKTVFNHGAKTFKFIKI